MFTEGELYYCFADEGDHFWIHAPFLLESLGVDQVKVSADSKKIFITRNEYEDRRLNTVNRRGQKLLES